LLCARHIEEYVFGSYIAQYGALLAQGIANAVIVNKQLNTQR
jgi:hypothetical protein